MLGQAGEPLPERGVPLDEQVEHLAQRVDGVACGMELALKRESGLSVRGRGARP